MPIDALVCMFSPSPNREASVATIGQLNPFRFEATPITSVHEWECDDRLSATQ